MGNIERNPTMTVRAAARALDVHENTIRNWITAGQMQAWESPGGFRRPYLSEVARVAEGDAGVPHGLADDLDAVAERLERRALALREAADRLRGQ
jgi:excisionase family DNA binding protein